ncbi:MAG: hydroxymethylglutaryl-CoA synthase, partial [Microgenomates group bacterium]
CDEDSLTMAFEASFLALDGFKEKDKIKVVFFGSETPPYAVNPSSTILAEFLGIEKNYLGRDHQIACKATTGAMISALGLISSGFTEYALIVASDKGVAKTHDPLEYTVGAGAVSLLLGGKDVLLEVVDFTSFSSDTPDFWRREGIRYPSHGGRFTGKPSYFYHIKEASLNLLKKSKLNPPNFKFAIFHMPNGKFPLEIGLSLGFTKEQLLPGLIVSFLGNCYTASALMGLLAVLEKAKVGDLIFLASYGSGAGSDAFVFRVTKNINTARRNFNLKLKDKQYIDYPTYLKFMGTI